MQSDGSTSQMSIVGTLLALQNVGIEVEEAIVGVSIGMTLNRQLLLTFVCMKIFMIYDLKLLVQKQVIFQFT